MDVKQKGEVVNFLRQKNYVWEKYLDEGGLGKTALILDPIINEYFVCKKYEPQTFVNKFEYYENFKNEIRIMHKLFHNNIVRIFNYYLYPEQTTGYILMDFIDGTDIESYIAWSPEDINIVFEQTIDAFSYLEKHNILHRDIRPKNILVTNDKVVKIIDFGFGKEIANDKDIDKSISINWLYEKPDDFNASIYDYKTEIYFVGKLFETMIKDYAISGFKHKDLLRKMIIKSHEDRISSFQKVSEEIITASYIFDDYFNHDEKETFQHFMEQVIGIYSDVGSEANYFTDIDQLAIELEEILRNNTLEDKVQNIVDISRAFVKGSYSYYSSKEVFVFRLKLFIQLIKTSNLEKKNIIKLSIINRLRTIKKTKKQEKIPFDNIPF
jgi:serine/threonine-protein kinase